MHFVHLDRLNLVRQRGSRQLCDMGIDPVGDTLMVDTQLAGHPSQVAAIQVHLYRSQADCVTVALLFWLRCVAMSARLALVSLAARSRSSALDLPFALVTLRTFHPPIISHVHSLRHSLGLTIPCCYITWVQADVVDFNRHHSLRPEIHFRDGHPSGAAGSAASRIPRAQVQRLACEKHSWRRNVGAALCGRPIFQP